MDYEYVLLAKPHISVYQAPPMTSSKGHMMDSWKNKIANCSLKVMAKGHRCSVILHDENGSLFAQAPIQENHELSVMPTADSSRAFALKVPNPTGSGSVWIGLVFRERNDAFDFKVCFEDFAKTRDMELHPERYAAENKPTKDFSLKPGEKIKFSLGEGTNFQNKPKAPISGFSGGILAPPPGFNKPSSGFPLPPGMQSNIQTQQQQPMNQMQSKPQLNSTNNTDLMDLFGGSDSNKTTSTKSPELNQGNNFTSVGLTQYQQQPPQNAFEFSGNNASGFGNDMGNFGGFGGSTAFGGPANNTGFGAPGSNTSFGAPGNNTGFGGPGISSPGYNTGFGGPRSNTGFGGPSGSFGSQPTYTQGSNNMGGLNQPPYGNTNTNTNNSNKGNMTNVNLLDLQS